MTRPKQSDQSTIFLLRHGETASPQGIFYGQQDVALSERGIAQSVAVAARLEKEGLDMVVTSDLERCRFMGKAIAEKAGLSLETEPGLREGDFGRWTGLAWQEIEKEYPDEAAEWIRDPAGTTPPDGESISSLKRRVMQVFNAICMKKGRKKIAVVAHGGVNRAIISELLGIKPEFMFRISQDFACINVMELYEQQYWSVRHINMPLNIL
jgi:alpha-ribazole phosphatase/probable phosphoglycerate mutase